MLDRVQEKYMSVGDCSNTNLFGIATKKGEMDVMLALLELKDYLLYEFLPSLGLDGQVTKGLHNNFDCISVYRKKVPELDKDGNRAECDLLWMASWPIPTKRLAAFVEGILYKNQYQRLIRQNCANKQSSKEVLKMTEIAEELQSIQDALKPEESTGEGTVISDAQGQKTNGRSPRNG